MIFILQKIKNKSWLNNHDLNLSIQPREILPPRGSLILSTCKPKWAWTGVKKQDGFLAASGELMKDGLSVIVSI